MNTNKKQPPQSQPQQQQQPSGRARKGKEGRPKRPLSAYNFFFQSERQRLLEELPVRAQGKPRRSHGKIGFQDMAKVIGARWKNLDNATRSQFELLQEQDKQRHAKEMEEYRRTHPASRRRRRRKKLEGSPAASAEARPLAYSAESSTPVAPAAQVLKPPPNDSRKSSHPMAMANEHAESAKRESLSHHSHEDRRQHPFQADFEEQYQHAFARYPDNERPPLDMMPDYAPYREQEFQGHEDLGPDDLEPIPIHDPNQQLELPPRNWGSSSADLAHVFDEDMINRLEKAIKPP